MKVVGLITEYNPFHNGHLYHIEKAKELTGADTALVVMSGNFVQRGAPAVMPKHLRATAALLAGADIILELPAAFSTGSAEYFASGAVSLLEQTGCVDALCFGSECGDSDILSAVAHTVADEPDEYQTLLREFLRSGASFPVARQAALRAYFKNDAVSPILDKPNNILGIEYIKALYQRNSRIEVHTIRRTGSGYHDKELKEEYSSASAIRERLLDTDTFSLKNQVPDSCIPALEASFRTRYPVCTDDFSLLLKHRLLCENKDSLMQYMDVTEELAGRIMNHLNEFITFEQFCNRIKTKNMTYSRISRCFFHILLHITSADMEDYRSRDFCQYAHILGFRKDSADLLACLKEHSRIPLLTKLTQTKELDAVGQKQLNQDIFASDLYESVITDKYKTSFISEYQQQIVRI